MRSPLFILHDFVSARKLLVDQLQIPPLLSVVCGFIIQGEREKVKSLFPILQKGTGKMQTMRIVRTNRYRMFTEERRFCSRPFSVFVYNKRCKSAFTF